MTLKFHRETPTTDKHFQTSGWIQNELTKARSTPLYRRQMVGKAGKPRLQPHIRSCAVQEGTRKEKRSALNAISLSNPSSQVSGNPLQEVAERVPRATGMENNNKTSPSKLTRSTYVWTHGDRSSVRRVQGSAPAAFLKMKRFSLQVFYWEWIPAPNSNPLFPKVTFCLWPYITTTESVPHKLHVIIINWIGLLVSRWENLPFPLLCPCSSLF